MTEKQQKRADERTERLMPGGVPRWIRCYDNGGESFDRYTVCYTGRLPGYLPGRHQYVGMSEHPYDPCGFGQHGEYRGPSHIDRFRNGFPPAMGRKCHLGKRIAFGDLPPDCQKLVLSDYREIWSI